MTLLIEDSEEMPCSHCEHLRKTFLMIAMSAVLPMLIFAGLLILVSLGHIETSVETTISSIVEFVFGLLYVQLFVATSIVIISFLRRRHPLLKYHYWYMLFHLVIMGMFLCSCLVMTIVNETYVTSCIVLIGGAAYYYILYHCMESNRRSWVVLRRNY